MIMMAPETYYEWYLKGRSKEEIIKKIRSLKREINQIKFRLEAPDILRMKYDITSCDRDPGFCKSYLKKKQYRHTKKQVAYISLPEQS